MWYCLLTILFFSLAIQKKTIRYDRFKKLPSPG